MNSSRPDASSARHPLVVVMGVSGSGKSTVGAELARVLQVPFADADDFHPAADVAKMAKGIALTDDDRWPWLDATGSWLARHTDTGAVLTCSSLKRSYRDALRSRAPTLMLLYLRGDRSVIHARLAARLHHFMPVSLLDSQFATLEPPDADERAVTVDVSDPPDDIVGAFLSALTDA